MYEKLLVHGIKQSSTDVEKQREMPMIFTSDSIRALLAGHKVKTRRVIKPQPARFHADGYDQWIWSPQMFEDYRFWRDEWRRREDKRYANWLDEIRNPPSMRSFARYKIGDIVWAKEDFSTRMMNGEFQIVYKVDNQVRSFEDFNVTGKPYAWWCDERARSARYMFKAFTRIWRVVVNVDTERLQDITQGDVVGEGIDIPAEGLIDTFDPIQRATLFPALNDKWRRHWDAINAARGYDYDSNPWCFAYTLAQTDNPPVLGRREGGR